MSKKKNSSKASSLITDNLAPVEKLVRKTNYPGIIVSAKNEKQKEGIKTILTNTITFLHGIAGVGKTHLAVGIGLQKLLRGDTDRLVLTRPYVEAGESLGFLPGSFNSKIAPFMYPLMEIIGGYIGKELTIELIDAGRINIIPLAYMRGVTFNNCFIVMDEAQNTTSKQMRMALTRIGENSKMVITGDVNQSDIHGLNGLSDALNRLKDIENIGYCFLDESACVRSPIIVKIEERYKDQNKE